MAMKKAPSPAPTARPSAVKEELEYLYLRRLAVEDLIDSMEAYCRLQQEIKNQTNRAA
jgi:hypothetical protein